MPILYSSQAGKAPPGKVGCRGLDTPCTAYISYLKAHKFFFVCAPVGMPDVCMWYVVLGMRYEVRGMRYVVQGTRYGTRGTETVCGAPLLTPEISFHQIMLHGGCVQRPCNQQTI